MSLLCSQCNVFIVGGNDGKCVNPNSDKSNSVDLFLIHIAIRCNATLLYRLYCDNNQLVELPINLPTSLQYLYCHNNQLSELPKNLPTSLKTLDCNANCIKTLPINLPNSLQVLSCCHNIINDLPIKLPSALKELYCTYNQIKELSALPLSLNRIKCDNNPYLYVSKKHANLFESLEETPNYTSKASIIQRNWRMIKYKKIMIEMIDNNDNQLAYSFHNNGDINIIDIICNFCL